MVLTTSILDVRVPWHELRWRLGEATSGPKVGGVTVGGVASSRQCMYGVLNKAAQAGITSPSSDAQSI